MSVPLTHAHTHLHTQHTCCLLLWLLTTLALLNDIDKLACLETDFCRLLFLVIGQHHVLFQEHGVRSIQTWGRWKKTCCQPAASRRSTRTADGHSLCHRPLCLSQSQDSVHLLHSLAIELHPHLAQHQGDKDAKVLGTKTAKSEGSNPFCFLLKRLHPRSVKDMFRSADAGEHGVKSRRGRRVSWSQLRTGQKSQRKSFLWKINHLLKSLLLLSWGWSWRESRGVV